LSIKFALSSLCEIVFFLLGGDLCRLSLWLRRLPLGANKGDIHDENEDNADDF